ncbi:MAG: small nucleolar ribonucleoprotein [Candidatus Diapherotrites archaeon]|nr:small nucleolar ribonucleoprotein [Candidatus Diapherotrites archaeon]MDN5367068.1 small nucleolar ribonucleoprotein [Candidatus Diapherotrites archaeon]
MIIITTSRKPSRRTRRFCRELQSVLPHSFYVNRGKASLRLFAERARTDGYYRAFIVGETKGNPSIIRVLDLHDEPFRWMGQLYITNVSLLLDRGEKPVPVDADDLVVDVDAFPVLKEIFDVYDGEEGVILEERGGSVRFLVDGEEVGPRFRITGWDPVPAKLDSVLR